MMLDPLYIVIMLPAILLAGVASLMVKATFKRYSTIPSASGLSGSQAALRMLRASGVYDVQVEQSQGFLSDHYDPSKKVLRLSPQVYHANSLSAVGVACHEAGHAIQHAEQYAPLMLRTALVPVTNFSSLSAFYVFLAGMLLSSQPLIYAGCILFAGAFVFSVVTLPVEWDASLRARRHMVAAGVVSPGQEREAGRVLNAAFLTYLAGAVSSLMTLLYFLVRGGVIGRRD